MNVSPYPVEEAATESVALPVVVPARTDHVALREAPPSAAGSIDESDCAAVDPPAKAHPEGSVSVTVGDGARKSPSLRTETVTDPVACPAMSEGADVNVHTRSGGSAAVGVATDASA